MPAMGRERDIVDCGSWVRHHRLMNHHERGFLNFLAEPTKRRMETLLELGDRRRRDVRDLLDHSVRLDPRYSQKLTGSDATSDPITAMLRKRGAPPCCYVLSSHSALDGREMPLDEALVDIVGRGHGTFVSCIPGRLGYYEYEDANSSYLLSR